VGSGDRCGHHCRERRGSPRRPAGVSRGGQHPGAVDHHNHHDATYDDASATYDDASATYDDASATYDDASATYDDASATYDDTPARSTDHLN